MKKLLILFVFVALMGGVHAQKVIEPFVTANKVELDSLNTDSLYGSFWLDGNTFKIYGTSGWQEFTTASDVYWSSTGNYVYLKTLTDSVGIGIAAPTMALDVVGSTKTSLNLTVGDSLFGDGSKWETDPHEATNVLIGKNAGTTNAAHGTNNIGIGEDALKALEGTGNRNICIGTDVGKAITTGSGNILLGWLNYAGTIGGNNVIIGSTSGRYATGGNNLFLGYASGIDQTGNYHIIIDNRDRTSEALGQTLAPFYAVTDAVGANQTLQLGGGGKVGIGTITPISALEVENGLTTTGAVFSLGTKETTVVDGDKLGQINFYAPLEASGTDAILNGASIWAEADSTFEADDNSTSLVFATGASEAAAEKMRLDSEGNLTVSGDVTVTGIIINGAAGGQTYISTPGVQTIGTGGTFEKLYEGAMAYTSSHPYNCTCSNGRLTYTGTPTIHATVVCNLTIQSGEAAQVLNFRIAENGTSIVGSNQTKTYVAQTVDRSAGLNWLVELATNDYIEIYGTSDTNGDTFTVQSLSLFVVKH